MKLIIEGTEEEISLFLNKKKLDVKISNTKRNLPILKYLRVNSGLTQREVAERIGIDQSAVALWETGKTAPRASILIKLSELYHCTVDDLLRDDEKE